MQGPTRPPHTNQPQEMDLDDPRLARRLNRVRVLLRTRNEPYEGVLSRSEETSSGFGDPHERRMTHAACKGRGCPECRHGKVTVTERDPYDTGQDLRHFDQRKTMDPKEVDAELHRLRMAERARAAKPGEVVDPREAYPWERAAERQCRQGSYAELDRALEQLRSSDLVASAHIQRLYLDGGAWAFWGDGFATEERAVRFLAERMPDHIRIPPEARDEEMAEVETAVRAQPRATLSALAEALGVSKHQIRKIRARKIAAG